MSEHTFRKLDPMPRFNNSGVQEWRWLLTGPEGAMQFLVYAYPTSDTRWDIYGAYPFNYPKVDSWWLSGVDVGAHRRRCMPADAGGYAHFDECEYLDGAPCWYDGSGLVAEEVLRAWIGRDRDDEVIRAALESRYDAWLAAL